MKAIRVDEFGGPEVLMLVDAPTPTPGPGQILIRVASAAVNFSDVMRRRDDVYPFPTTLPYVPGGEVAGTVEALGEGVAMPPIGTRVFALVGSDGSGGYAQFAIADAQQVIPIPKGVSDDQAAALVIPGSTAFLALSTIANLGAGETVLIQGAGGGVGGYAVQIAKLLGATVVASASSSTKRDAAIAWGADHVVDSADPAWPEAVRGATDGRGVNVAWEISGGDSFEKALSVLAPFGRVVVAGRASGRPLTVSEAAIESFFYRPSLGQTIHNFNLGLFFGLKPEAAVAALQTVIGYVASGQVVVPVGDVRPLAQADAAHRAIEDRTSRGITILKPWM